MTIKTFLNGQHDLVPLAERLNREFIPVEGATLYVESELLRAANRLSWDYYNNGWGNNMSQAVAYIVEYHIPQATNEFIAAFRDISMDALAGIPSMSSRTHEPFEAAMVLMMVEILERLDAAAQAGKLTPIGREMFDMPFTEIDYGSDEDEDCDYDGERLAA